MAESSFALLKSLTIRPVRTVARDMEPLVFALQCAGYVSYGPDGWIATAEGCEVIERERSWPRTETAQPRNRP
jgi:hypothetical protein